MKKNHRDQGQTPESSEGARRATGEKKAIPAWLGTEAVPKGDEKSKSEEGSLEAPKRKPGRPKKDANPGAEPVKRRPGRPKGLGTASPREKKPKEDGGLLADYIKRDEAKRRIQDAVEAVYAKLPGLIEKELRRLLK